VISGGILEPIDRVAPDESAEPSTDEPQSPRTTIEPLVTTTDDGDGIDASTLIFRPEPRRVIEQFAVPEARSRLTIAGRVTGPARTAFPDGPPTPADDDEADADAANPAHLTEGEISVVIIADVDMFDNQFWVRQFNFGGTTLAQQTSDNAALLVNAAATMAGSDLLASLRGRASGERPLTKIEEMRAEADSALVEKDEALDAEIAEAETRLNDLLSRAGAEEARVTLPEEVRAEVARLEQRVQELGRERRDIRQELNRDIDRLQARLTLMNIAMVPAALFIFAIGLAATRSVGRRIDRRKGLGRG